MLTSAAAAAAAAAGGDDQHHHDGSSQRRSHQNRFVAPNFKRRQLIFDSFAKLKRTLSYDGQRGATVGPKGTLLYTWGAGYHGQLGLSSYRKKCKLEPAKIEFKEPVVQVACGGFHTALLTEKGKIYTWGDGHSGQLGNLARKRNMHATPHPVDNFLSDGALVKVTVTQISCGQYHTAAVTTAGGLFTWGSGKFGQLGHATRLDQRYPKLVAVEPEIGQFVQVACGDRHTAAVTRDKAVVTFGSGQHGQLGHGNGWDYLKPQLVQDLLDKQKKIEHVECGSTTTCAITSEGQLYLWGFGESVHPKEMTNIVDKPRLVRFKERVQQIACGQSHVLVLTDNGDVYAFGSAAMGQVGHGSKSNVRIPRLVLKGKEIHEIAAGRYHSLAVSAYGVLYSWGCGESGQLAHNSLETEFFPRIVEALLPNVVGQIACGEHHSFALSSIEHATVSQDVLNWKMIEDEELKLKNTMLKELPNGLKTKHVLQVEQERQRIIKEINDDMEREKEDEEKHLTEQIDSIHGTDALMKTVQEQHRTVDDGRMVIERGKELDLGEANLALLAEEYGHGDASSALGTGRSRASQRRSGRKKSTAGTHGRRRSMRGSKSTSALRTKGKPGGRHGHGHGHHHHHHHHHHHGGRLTIDSDSGDSDDDDDAGAFTATGPAALTVSSKDGKDGSGADGGVGKDGKDTGSELVPLVSGPDEHSSLVDDDHHHKHKRKGKHGNALVVSDKRKWLGHSASARSLSTQEQMLTFQPMVHRMNFIEKTTNALSRVKKYLQSGGLKQQPSSNQSLFALKKQFNTLKAEVKEKTRLLSQLRNAYAFMRPTEEDTNRSLHHQLRIKELNMKLVTLNTRLMEADENKKNYALYIIRMKEEDVQLSKQSDRLRNLVVEYDRLLAKMNKVNSRITRQKKQIDQEIVKFRRDIDEFASFAKEQLRDYERIMNRNLTNQRMQQKFAMIRDTKIDEKRQQRLDRLQTEYDSKAEEASEIKAELDIWLEKVAFYEQRFHKIQAATGLHRPEDIINKFFFNDEITEDLRNEIHLREQDIEELRERKQELASRLEKQKTTFVQSKWRDVDHLQEQVDDGSLKMDSKKGEYEQLIQRLAFVQEGIVSLSSNIDDTLGADKNISAIKKPDQAAPVHESVLWWLKNLERRVGTLVTVSNKKMRSSPSTSSVRSNAENISNNNNK